MAPDRTYNTEILGPIVPLPTGELFPMVASVHVWEGDPVEVTVMLRLQVVNGRPTLAGLEIGPYISGLPVEISARYVHNLPIDELTDGAVRAVAQTVAGRAAQYRTGAEVQAEATAAGEGAVTARRRRPVTDDYLREVARVVRDNPDESMKDIAKNYLHLSLRTAWRRVNEAKQRGYLPDDDEPKGVPTPRGVGTRCSREHH